MTVHMGAPSYEQTVGSFRSDKTIANILKLYTSGIYQADMSLSDELATLLVFAKRDTCIKVHGPEDFEQAQHALNKIQSYRERAIEVSLSATEKKIALELAWSMLQSVLLLKPEVMSKNESIKLATVNTVASEINDLKASWDILAKQAEAVVRNCRDAYNVLFLQIDIAKQMFYIRNMNRGISDPLAKEFHSRS